MGAEWEKLAEEFITSILEEIGKEIGTIRPIFFSQSSVGGYGILFGNTKGMILAYILLTAIGIFSIIGIFITIKSLIKLILFGRKKKMTPEEKWLKTGKL